MSSDSDSFLWQLLIMNASGTLVPMLAVTAVAIVLAAWGLGPVVWCEVMPPDRPGPGDPLRTPAGQDVKRDALNRLAGGLGRWLDRGYALLRVAGELLFLVMVPLLAIGLLPGRLGIGPVFEGYADMILGGLAGVIGAGAVGLLAFRGRFRSLTLGFRPLLDVALDVDNYLREHPRTTNPRARIMARYASLLRHLCKWRDPVQPDRGYDAIIIMAHSQGTAISADLLRFFWRQRQLMEQRPGSLPAQHPDGELEPLGGEIPVFLFTMGSPLRQLYGLRFPHLYRWAWHDVLTEWVQDNPTLIPPDQKPSPDELDVTLWVNAFRSGDYVGRFLWRSPRCSYQWELPSGEWEPDRDPRNVTQDAKYLRDARRREFCIGPGAHTHYWDSTAPLVAAELNRLVRLACQRRSWRAPAPNPGSGHAKVDEPEHIR